MCVCADPSVYDEIIQPVLHSGFLYKSGSVNRGTLSRKTREGGAVCVCGWLRGWAVSNGGHVILNPVPVPGPDFQRFWCSVDRALLLYESERSADPCLQISVRDIVSVGVARPASADNNNGFIDR